MDSTAPAPATCEIARLPDDLLSASLARTGPLDACRAAAVSPAFRAAADADAVWSSLLPRDLPPLADGELPDDPHSTKKQLFMRLSDSARPVLLADGLTVRDLDPPLVCLSVSIHPSADVITHPVVLCGVVPRAEHVAGQGHRRQVLHAVRQEAVHHMGRHAAVLALDPSHRLQVSEIKIFISIYPFIYRLVSSSLHTSQ